LRKPLTLHNNTSGSGCRACPVRGEHHSEGPPSAVPRLWGWLLNRQGKKRIRNFFILLTTSRSLHHSAGKISEKNRGSWRGHGGAIVNRFGGVHLASSKSDATTALSGDVPSMHGAMHVPMQMLWSGIVIELLLLCWLHGGTDGAPRANRTLPACQRCSYECLQGGGGVACWGLVGGFSGGSGSRALGLVAKPPALEPGALGRVAWVGVWWAGLGYLSNLGLIRVSFFSSPLCHVRLSNHGL